MGRLWVTSLVAGSAGGETHVWKGIGLLALSLVLLSGCGRGTFVGRQYDNFTAYYNKFYNANQAFEEGVESFEERTSSIDRTRYLSVFPAPDDGQGGESFEAVIQKSADVLREHPNSRWVDDALLLIGKSYFYQGNYVGAAQKFREALGVQEGRQTEARFWLARTLVTNGSYTKAEDVLAGRSGEDDGKWAARLELLYGQLLVRQEVWSEAETALARGLEGDVPDEPGARGAFVLGQVRETLQKPEAAQSAYRQVQEYGPRYELQFAARLSEIELQGRHGDADRALERLRDLQSDDKNLDKRGAMALVEARIYRAQGRTKRAQAVLREALRAGTSRQTEPISEQSAARIHYELAVLYRDDYKDFRRAAAHFDTAGTKMQSQTPERRLPTAPLDAQAQADQYRSLAKRSDEVARLDSLLRIGRMPPEEYRAFIQELRAERRAERKAEQQARRQSGRQLQGGGREAMARRREQKAAAKTGKAEAGFLFHKDPTRVRQGRRRFVEIWGDRPRVDDWRRRNAMNTAQADGDEQSPEEESPAPERETQAAASGVDVSAIPRDSASQAQMEAKRAVARYELGNALFLAAGRPDSAATWYRRVLQEDGDQPVARRALYALAEAHRAQGDSLAARQIYERLVSEYPESVLARRARDRLGDRQVSDQGNRAARADSMYARAYERWQTNGEPVLDELLHVAETYPDTDAAPRALLASAIIYWRQARADTSSGMRQSVTQYLHAVKEAEAASPSSLPQRETAPGRDTTGVAGDSVRTTREDRASDSLRTSADRTDSLRTAVPSGSVTRETSVQTDSVERRPSPDVVSRSDSTVARVDSTQRDSIPVDSTEARSRAASTSAADSSTATGEQAADDPWGPLEALLQHLTSRYETSPQAKQAKAIRAMMEEQQTTDANSAPETASETTRPDTTGPPTTSPDTTAPDPRAQSRSQRSSASTGGGGRRALPAPRNVVEDRADNDPAIPDTSAWTLLVSRAPTAAAAQERQRAVQARVDERWTATVVPAPRGEGHFVVLGRFRTKADAEEAEAQLRATGMETLRVRPWPSDSTDR